MLVARTDPEQPKHRGLTYFVIDMAQPGVDVRPLRQMTGQAEFNEVHLSDARVLDAHRLGEVGAGWKVAITTLMNERTAIGGSPGGAAAASSARRSACGGPTPTGTPRCCATGSRPCGPAPRPTASPRPRAAHRERRTARPGGLGVRWSAPS